MGDSAAKARADNIRARRGAERVRAITAPLRDSGSGQLVASRRLEGVTTDAQATANALAAMLAPSFARDLAYYKEREDVSRAPEAAEDNQARLTEEARATPTLQITWQQIGALAGVDLQAALEAWLRVLDYATDEAESGARGAAVSDETPLERARYIALRDSFAEQWKPEGGIDWALIDMLAQNYNLYLYWSHIAHSYSTGLCTNLDEMWNQRRRKTRNWKFPYEMAKDATEEAHRMAERYNRVFLRTLRQMRDLRRYAPPPASPVILNNGGQVNIANQQVNAQAAKP